VLHHQLCAILVKNSALSMNAQRTQELFDSLLEDARLLQYKDGEKDLVVGKIKGAIVAVFGKDSHHMSDLDNIRFLPTYVTNGTGESSYRSSFDAGKKKLGNLVLVLKYMVEASNYETDDATHLSRLLQGLRDNDVSGEVESIATFLGVHKDKAKFFRDEILRLNEGDRFFRYQKYQSGTFAVLELNHHVIDRFLSQEEFDVNKTTVKKMKEIRKVFISHSSLDKEIVEEVIEILEIIGLKADQIFCSSFEPYGVELGQNFLERIKDELDEDILVLFILSENFYKSAVSLCEMGATWIRTSEHIPIIVPPFRFEDMKGVFPTTLGMMINEKNKFNELKTKIERLFRLEQIESSVWERKRDRILKNIERKLK
jgi:hypothetical protein